MAAGVWLDEFNDHWLSTDVIEKHIESNKKVCVVSPELHNRQYVNEWDHYRKIESYIGKNKIMLCTDFPEKAEEFFNG